MDDFDVLNQDDKYDVEQIIIRKLNETFVHINASNSVCQSLSEYFSFYAEGYQWHPKVKARMWDGRIRLLNNRYNTFPLGLLDQLKTYLTEAGTQVEFENFSSEIDHQSLEEDFDRFYKTLVLPEEIVLRDYQKSAILKSLSQRRGIVISPTGSGKSFIIYCILRYGLSRALFKKILLMVPTINLVAQMYKDFGEYSKKDPNFDVEEFCHQIYGGKEKESKKPISISTWQSMATIKGPKSFHKFDSVICDECHLAEGKHMTRIIESSVNAQYKIGLTGTLKESKMNPLSLVGLFGELIHTKKTHELMELGVLSKTPVQAMILEYSKSDRKDFWKVMRDLKDKKQNKKVFSAELKFLHKHERRNKVILKLCQRLTNMNTLILFRNIEHIDEVEKILVSAGINVKRMSSDMSVDEREAIREYVENNIGVVVLSTYQLFQLGINIKNLHNAIFGAPSKGRIRIFQSFGRIIRIAPDGRVGHLIDLIDDLQQGGSKNFTWVHGLRRLQYYSEEKLKIKYKKVKM